MIIIDRTGTKGRFMTHTKSDPLQQLYQSYHSGRVNLMSLPICPKCERTGFRDKGWMTNRIMCCPACGYRGKATHQLAAYLDEGLYR